MAMIPRFDMTLINVYRIPVTTVAIVTAQTDMFARWIFPERCGIETPVQATHRRVGDQNCSGRSTAQI